jgi:predicted Rossmann fold nucleotide-binding protein DprA/Smf involved in DNA uptake
MTSYAGIGSRKTPWDICNTMVYLARALRRKGYTLRSGHAKGADQSFEMGGLFVLCCFSGLF